MFTLTMNDKPFDPKDLEKAIMAEALNKMKDNLHEQLSSIRHPETGEFPVVQVIGSEMEDIAIRIEGSPALLTLVRERISPDDLDKVMLIETTPTGHPKAFLSFGWEDRELAKTIAETLQANGIETWWAEWEIRAGDSLRQRIDEGLSNCTIFLVLLTPTSIKKPWVNQEMDAGLIRKVEERARFIPVRKDLPTVALPPLFRGMYSPDLQDVPNDMRQLINDIHACHESHRSGLRLSLPTSLSIPVILQQPQPSRKCSSSEQRTHCTSIRPCPHGNSARRPGYRTTTLRTPSTSSGT